MEFFDLKYFCLGGADDSDEASFANKKEEKADGANAATASSSSSSLASVPSSPAKEPQQSHLEAGFSFKGLGSDLGDAAGTGAAAFGRRCRRCGGHGRPEASKA